MLILSKNMLTTMRKGFIAVFKPTAGWDSSSVITYFLSLSERMLRERGNSYSRFVHLAGAGTGYCGLYGGMMTSEEREAIAETIDRALAASQQAMQARKEVSALLGTLKTYLIDFEKH